MRLRTYLLLVTLFSLLGISIVHQATRQTRIRYRIAELLLEERQLEERMVVLKREIAVLSDPVRLEALSRTQNLSLQPLRPLAPTDPATARAGNE